MVGKDRFFSNLGRSYKPGIITEIVLAAFEMAKKGKKLISLTGGSYDPPSLPVVEIREVLQEVPDTAWREILQYGSNQGYWRLREALSKFMKGSGITVDQEGEVLVTTGSQQALDLISRVFIDEGDIIGVGSPTYLAALSAFKQFSPQFLTIPVGDEGLDLGALEEELERLRREGKGMKMLYVVPSFQNPTGVVMPQPNRRRLLEMAEEYDFLIVEDNPYGYIAFEGEPPTPIKAFDEGGRVIYLSTFSKIVSPGLRIGWVAAEEEIVEKLAIAKSAVDLCSDGLSQYVASELLSRGVVERQIRKVTDVYREKRDLMLESMEVYFPKEVEWNRPRGGLFLWVRLPEGVDASEMVFEAVERGVAYIPGSNFFTDPSKTNYMRLNYSFPSKEDIVEGIKILGDLLKERV
ncbi:PLP-dependent aminotransferase family protein [Candidatus Bathyarchaeota archaeon]|nr:PLP-dependent aminotransferase family protein [Candidatus Bathyarchaeota archaeon]